MKAVLIIPILFCSFLKAQTGLTRGQVFNFDAGDIICGTISSSQNGGNFHTVRKTTKYLSKTFTPNNDSIIYIVQQTFFEPPACQTCSANTSSSTSTLVVTNLNDTIPKANLTTCMPLTDTLYLDYCNRRTYNIHPVSTYTSCFEPSTETSFYVEGVGYFYDKYIANAPDYSESYALSYYIKQSGSCGDTYIHEQTGKVLPAVVYPNPAKDVLQIESVPGVLYVNIVDISGRSFKSDFVKNNQVAIAELPAGIYFATVYSAGLKSKTIKLVKD